MTRTSRSLWDSESSAACAMDPIPRYEFARRYSGGPQQGTRALRDHFLYPRFGARRAGIYNERTIRGSNQISLHGEGRAVDYYVNAHRPDDLAVGNEIVRQLLAADAAGNPYALARRLGVQEIIWNGRIWTSAHADRGMRPYDGVDPHTSHVHIGQNWAGARAETSFFHGCATPAPQVASTGSPPTSGEPDFIRAQIAAGIRDANRLTDLVLFRRHPELRGAPLHGGQEALMAEWRDILQRVVTPVLAAVRGGSPTPRAPHAPQVDNDLRSALRRWNMPTGVAGAPLFHQLVERWRRVHAPEMPLPLLVAFSTLEAFGFGDATHGKAENNYTSPEFYELGVFQVPAGLHGSCTGSDHASCANPPPGIPSRDLDPWHGICARLRLNPDAWQDPTTQVRVGLENLETDARTTRGRFRDLFPHPGSDWDLRAAVLLPFGPGIGYTLRLLARHRAALVAMPEEARWSYLRAQGASTDNVDRKMSLAARLTAALSSATSPTPELF